MLTAPPVSSFTIGRIAKLRIQTLPHRMPVAVHWDARKISLESQTSERPPTAKASSRPSGGHPGGKEYKSSALLARPLIVLTLASFGLASAGRLRGSNRDGAATDRTDAASTPASEEPVVQAPMGRHAVTPTLGLRKTMAIGAGTRALRK